MESPTRRRVLGALALGGLGAAGTRGDLFEVVAPFSGRAVDGLGETGPATVANPYGPAEIRYDDFGVPHIDAESEQALYFAAGYAQARDRLFQIDLFRRNMRGELSAVFGERTVESDRFHRQMDFLAAAEATWDGLEGTAVAGPIEALADGINRYLDVVSALPLEFQLLEYEPDPWTPVDTALIAKQIAWGLTGSFWDLERRVILDRLGEQALALYPERFDHEYPIIRSDIHDTDDLATDGDAVSGTAIPDASVQELQEWLGRFGNSGAPVGSNNWVVSGQHTASGSPILANDPHLTLQVPPVWYEMHLRQGEMDVRGVGLPGAPLVVIGQNRDVTWGVTNVGADVIDFYSYETRSDGQEYRYDGEWRSIEQRTETIEVSDGSDREVEVAKTVHGPVLEREGQRVAVSWVGLSATREPLAIYRYNHASNITEFTNGLRVFDIPGQNTVYADRHGRTMYYPAAKYPIRRIDGEVVAGNQIFDGSAQAGEWRGFTPYGQSSWEGFVDFEDIPHLIDPAYVATANQRLIDESTQYMGDVEYIGEPYRSHRIYEWLDAAIADGPVDVADMQALQNDVRSIHADTWVPQIVAARPETDGPAREYVDLLEDWDREMRSDSRAALVYSVWVEEFRAAVLGDEFGAADLGESYYPGEDWPIQTLPADSDWFDDETTEETEDRSAVIATAMAATVERIRVEGWETYGDRHRLSMEHPFPLDFLDYPARPVGGSANTVFNIGADGSHGSSWRMITQFDGPSYCVLPGGNSGRYGSPHYDDQVEMWATGEYKEMSLEMPPETDIEFPEGSE